MWSDWLVFCDCGFQSVCPLMENDTRLMEASWWERLTVGETGSCSDGQAVLSKSLIQFSVDGRGCVPSLLFSLKPNYGGDNEDNGHLLQKVPCMHYFTQCPWPCSRPPLTRRLLDTHRQVWVSLLWGHCEHTVSPGSWCAQGFVCALQESVSPVLCKFWWFYGGVNGDLLQEGLCHTQVCCTQSPYPCSRPLLTCTVMLKHSKAGLASLRETIKLEVNIWSCFSFFQHIFLSLLPNSFTYNVLQQRLQRKDVGFVSSLVIQQTLGQSTNYPDIQVSSLSLDGIHNKPSFPKTHL